MAQDVYRKLTVTLLLAVSLVAAGGASAQVALPAPKWGELTPQQKTTLAPLSSEWDQLDNARRKKWLGIAERYPTMAPDKQARVQSQMRTWASLTPAQRRIAREQYQAMRKLPPEQKAEMRAKWEQYRNLPPEKQQEMRSRALARTVPPAKPTVPMRAVPPASTGTMGATPAAPAAPVGTPPPPPQ